MSNPDDLDEALRAKLRAAAEREPLPARPERHAQWAAALVREQRTHARRRRVVGASVGTAVALAAAALLMLWSAPRAELPRAAQPGPSCALPQNVSIHTDAAGTQRIELGRFGALAATADSVLHIESSAPCLLALRLDRGELAGDLNQLKPALLRVRTPEATVVVRGTRFSVRAGDELEVVLLSGRVEVENGSTRMMEPKQVLRKRGSSWRMRATQELEAQRVAGILAGEPPVFRVASEEPVQPVEVETRGARKQASEKDAGSAQPQVSAAELLARAERARRDDEKERARALYAQASQHVDADAEVALLRWVRFELAERAFDQATKLLARHGERFQSGKLKAEAAWLGVVLLRDRGDASAARAAAQAFVTDFPRAPQAESARGLLRAPPR